MREGVRSLKPSATRNAIRVLQHTLRQIMGMEYLLGGSAFFHGHGIHHHEEPMYGCALLLLLASLPMWGQTGSGAGIQSIGDAVKNEDKINHSQPIYVVYVHGINQVGPGDSLLLRKGICKYLGDCTVTPLGRVYADSGPFEIDHRPPRITYMGAPVWRTQQEWNASSPFIDRYRIVGGGHVPIVV